MADNTVLNLGSGGDTISTDDLGGGIKVQRAKATWGVDGTSTDVTLTTPLPVSPLGWPVTVQTDVTRPADTAVYAAADAISNSTSAPTSGGFTWTSAARKSGGSGLITDITVASSNAPATRLAGEIFIFNQAVTNINDNAAFAVSDAEIKTCVGVVPFSLFNAGNNGFAHIIGLNLMFTCVGTANLRFLVRARNAYTPASAEVLSFTAKIIQID